jgi:hypothetical protein
MNRRMSTAIMGVVALVLGTVLAIPAFATATGGGGGGNEGVCQPQSAHLFPHKNNITTLTYTAPAGMLISGWCVKAGSIKQGFGPEYHTVNPPAASVVISHSTLKDISHYTVTLVPKGDDPSETPTVPPVTQTPTPTPSEPPVTETPGTETPSPTVPPVTETPSPTVPPVTDTPSPTPTPSEPPVTDPPSIGEPLPPVSQPPGKPTREVRCVGDALDITITDADGNVEHRSIQGAPRCAPEKGAPPVIEEGM